jgi:hypothetical protein
VKELKTRNKITMMAAVGAVTLLAAGCGSAAAGGSGPAASPASPAAAASRPAVAANPVTILRETGARVPHGTVSGDHDAFGDRMAEGTLGPKGWEQVTVYTAADDQALRALLRLPGQQPDDYTGVIVIPSAHAVVLATAWEDNGPRWAARGTPAQIAQRVHGQLVGGQA